MFLHVFLLVCLIINNAFCAKPILDHLPSQVSKIENSVVILSCSLSSGSTPIRYSWFYNTQKLIPNKNILIENDLQYSVLKILNVQKQQNGNYSCQAENAFGKDVTSSRLFVKVPPTWTKEPKDIDLRIGEDATVECAADGLPKPAIKWITPSGRVIEGEVLDVGRLIREEKRGKQAQRFECVADNGIGDALRKFISVSYNVPVKFDEKYTAIQARRGERIVLKCNATGDRPITIKWTKDGVKLEKIDDPNHDLVEMPTGRGILSELTIRSIQKVDSAVYKCDAENEHGKDDRTHKVTVVEEPGAPTHLKINEVWSRSASISWRPSHGSNVPLSHYIVQYWRKTTGSHRLHEVNVSATQNNFILKGLNPGLNYDLTISGENEIGRGEVSETLSFTTGEEEPSSPPNDFSVETKGPTAVRITWRAPPRESWNGLLKGFYIGYRKQSDSSAPYTLKSVDAKHNNPEQIVNENYEYFLRDLHKGTEYEFVVKAYNMAGSGPETQPSIAMTADGDVPPSQSLVAVDSSLTSISIHWNQKFIHENQQYSPASYMIHYQKEGDINWQEIPLSSLTTSAPPVENAVPTFAYTISGLETGQTYKMFVVARNRYGVSDPSNIVTVKTDGERIVPSTIAGNPFSPSVYDIPHYMQPAFMIPILGAFVIVVVVGIFALVMVKRAKHRAATANLIIDSATMRKQFVDPTYGTSPRYADFDGKTIQTMVRAGETHPGIFPTPYATMPMNELPQNIYDQPT